MLLHYKYNRHNLVPFSCVSGVTNLICALFHNISKRNNFVLNIFYGRITASCVKISRSTSKSQHESVASTKIFLFFIAIQYIIMLLHGQLEFWTTGTKGKVHHLPCRLHPPRKEWMPSVRGKRFYCIFLRDKFIFLFVLRYKTVFQKVDVLSNKLYCALRSV